MSKHARWILIPVIPVLTIIALMSLPMPAGHSLAQGFMTNTPSGASAVATGTPVATQPVVEPTTDAPATVVTQAAAATPTAVASPTPVIESTPLPGPDVGLPEVCAYVPGQTVNDACRALIEANLRPNLAPVNQDLYTMSNYDFWRVGPEAVQKYNAPNGTPTSVIPQGFNFVTVLDSTSTPGWLKIQGNEWIRTENTYHVEPSYFTGVLIPPDWQFPFLWVLDTTGVYASSVPGGEPDAATGLIPLRYQMFNVFAAAEDSEGWEWYMIGPDQWIRQTFVSIVTPVDRPADVRGRWIGVDLFEQNLVAYEDNQPVFATLVSTGEDGNDTNEGVFEIWARLDRDAMSGATGAPDAYDLQTVPWTLYFDESISIHGTYWHDLFGYRTSHGCVNLTISDARWVFEWTAGTPLNAEGERVNYVYVFSSGVYR